MQEETSIYELRSLKPKLHTRNESEYKQFKKLYEELICKYYDVYACKKVIENINQKWSKTPLDTKQDVEYISTKQENL